MGLVAEHAFWKCGKRPLVHPYRNALKASGATGLCTHDSGWQEEAGDRSVVLLASKAAL